MRTLVKGMVYGKTVELEQPLSLPDGSPVLLSVESLSDSDEDRGHRLRDLSGAWKTDPSISVIFEEITQERRGHKAREVPSA
jgi:hypothetical protein